ncbi:hypothetical protein SAMN05421820_103130 [Pedobacter steynii]|uniref:Uncharacterized protein n=1 Tax=Pedobacter steynii TaxID=430522 RepID=A0A1G9R7P2_9SPHI|nr:DUF6266 family protein [Pedobacter steynii]NQX37869.1 hypothetical protein [Pedobacter steynii]SDM18455.1 hypothetical protein SAMN05421820_103130 [Pedobacter steynii]
MATSRNRLPSGKLGNTVSYELNGKMVTRGIGENNKKRSKSQLTVMQKTKVTSKFLNPVMAFIRVGFEIEAKLTKAHPQNPAFVYNWRNATKGNYPKIKIDFEKALLTKGDLPMSLGAKIKLVDTGVEFSWNGEADPEGSHWSDQVMMLAYFPELNMAKFVTAGAARSIGKDLLPLFIENKKSLMELYISFISSDRKRISNSVYVGKLFW